MKAVVMAGGEGTRLRPLTSNQPKPMVPIVGKPCMEHILDLLHRHGMNEVVVTLAFMPQAIRTYFGGGESLDMDVDYSVEEQPLGTAGSVRLAQERLDETFLVISCDALCDVDLGSLVDAHRAKGAAVTITSSKPWLFRSSTMCSMQGLPTIGTIGFGWLDVRGRSRVPSPPAITTAFTAAPPGAP